MPHSMNAKWFIFFQKEVVSTSVKNYSRMKATDYMIVVVRMLGNLGSHIILSAL